MNKLAVSDLYSLEEYHRLRADFRARVLAHKKLRQVAVGPSATLYFEDRLTMQYQVQEMLRIERIFQTEAIEEELSAYNPLIPDGKNLKATFMIEVPDAEERRRVLERLAGIEHGVWAEAPGFDRMFAHADEDLERTTAEKTSAVHFLRFELDEPMIAALTDGSRLVLGIEHPQYRHRTELSDAAREALVADLD